ncbi:MAG: hypothetical protein KJ063_15825 [Anaerolineae bacterium]|nr:hypothetical protein [Anaerolineae bacterium]
MRSYFIFAPIVMGVRPYLRREIFGPALGLFAAASPHLRIATAVSLVRIGTSF